MSILVSTVPESICDSLGKRIDEICSFSFGQLHGESHCAHYVSHIMGYEFEKTATCKNSTWDDKQKDEKGANLRVNELFNRCTKVGLYSAKPTSLLECLVFVTLASNMTKAGTRLTMKTQPKKHIGILYGNQIWNYSNTKDEVVADEIQAFKSKFSTAYKTKGTTVNFYYGKFL